MVDRKKSLGNVDLESFKKNKDRRKIYFVTQNVIQERINGRTATLSSWFKRIYDRDIIMRLTRNMQRETARIFAEIFQPA